MQSISHDLLSLLTFGNAQRPGQAEKARGLYQITSSMTILKLTIGVEYSKNNVN